MTCLSVLDLRKTRQHALHCFMMFHVCVWPLFNSGKSLHMSQGTLVGLGNILLADGRLGNERGNESDGSDGSDGSGFLPGPVTWWFDGM